MPLIRYIAIKAAILALAAYIVTKLMEHKPARW